MSYTLLFIIKTVLYFLIVLLGFLVTVPLGVTTGKFNGACLLFGHVTAPDGAPLPTGVVGGPSGMCGFTTYLHGIACILIALCWAIIHVIALTGACKGAMVEFLDNFVSRVLTLLLQVVICILVFSSACIISTGFLHFCRSVTSRGGIETCESLEEKGIPSYDTSSFYLCLMMAMGSSWISFLLWAVQTGLNLFQIIRQRRSRTKEVVTSTTANTPATRSPIYKPAAQEDPDVKMYDTRDDTAAVYAEDTPMYTDDAPVAKEERTSMTRRY